VIHPRRPVSTAVSSNFENNDLHPHRVGSSRPITRRTERRRGVTTALKHYFAALSRTNRGTSDSMPGLDELQGRADRHPLASGLMEFSSIEPTPDLERRPVERAQQA
jgi:hypothetical protein